MDLESVSMRGGLRLAVFAPNVMSGGGLTHLVGLLRGLTTELPSDLAEIVVFVRPTVAAQIQELPFVRVVARRSYDWTAVAFLGGLLAKFDRALRDCHVVLNVGPAVCFSRSPVVSMCRNLLPFEWRELSRFKSSPLVLKLLALRIAHSIVFRSSDGVIFLSRYAQSVVSLGKCKRIRVIPHGIGREFTRVGEERLASSVRPNRGGVLRIIYVSIINFHKNQIAVMRAVAELRRLGRNVETVFIGPAYAPALRRFDQVRRALDPSESFLRYEGNLSHEKLPERLRDADVFLFASSCENFPNILVEAMAVGLPVLCSKLGPMPEIAADAAIYFDPDDSASISAAIESLINDPDRQASLARKAYLRSLEFNWHRTASETWGFLRDVMNTHSKSVK